MWLQPKTLIGEYSKLEPLSLSHKEGLIESVKDGELWKLWYTLIPHPDKVEDEIKRRLSLQKQGMMLPFAIFDNKSDEIVGATTFLNADSTNLRIEIGATWLAKSRHRTGINTEVKLLLLQHAFEDLQCNAVEFRTHFFNQQSRKGIERLGAKLDGILRNHMVMPDGTLRDTCVYSILKTEWSTVKAHLTFLNNKNQKAQLK